MLNLQNVSVSFKDTVALKNISVTIQSGEVVALIGPSGAGKTTLLNTLYSIKEDNSAFVHQNYALVPQLSVFHNVYIGRLDYHSIPYNLLNLVCPQTKEVQQILSILKPLGMSENLQKRVNELSGGQQQRTAIARAMYRDVDVIFADEPVSSIDPHQADSILELITTMTNTVILSLHSVELALRFAKRIIGLRLGKIVFDLPTAKVDEKLLSELYQPC